MIRILIDVHCHANLYLTLSNIIEDARQVGVEKIIAVAMSSMSQERIIAISNQYKEIFPALGIHPEEIKVNKKIESELDKVSEYIISHGKEICAIGEIGLDHHFIKEKELYPLQERVFNRMLSLAQELQLPVNLHTKGAEKTVFETLPSYRIPNINIHWYSGPEKYLKIGMDRGYYFSITPAIDYSPAVRKVVTLIDREHLLLESDGPVKYGELTGAPSLLLNTLKAVSTIKNIEIEEMNNQIEQNTRTIFPKIF